MTLQTPPSLSEPEIDAGDDKHHTLTVLNNSDERFKEIAIDFNNAGMNVTQVEMLANKHLWKRYATEREMILEQRKKSDPDFKLNERYLYHGTTMKKSYICDEGLDSRMSNEGCFGKGIYFSDFPKKCVKYAKKGNGDESYILLARVILGVPKVYPRGQKARALKREPEKEEPYTGHRFYDSVEGCPVNHKEFVVYESRRALVEGIITFTVEKKEKKEKKAKVNPVLFEDEEDSSNFNNLDGDHSESDNDADDKDGTAYCTGDSSSDDEDRAGDDKGGFDKESSSSDEDSETSDSDVEDSRLIKTKDELEQLLVQKRRQFSDSTGLTDEFDVECYLLRGGMDVTAAIRIYEDKKAAGFPESEDDDDDSFSDVPTQDHPLPGSEGWKALSKEDQEVFIECQIDDFLNITGLDPVEERGFARKCLSAVNMNLDHAVLAYYEDF